ncbi:nucleotidyltransferase family protein [Tenacibaculum aestuariivivum]|uniref:nucleotidyltransferase family protein n=1 Tax=Tenacibaculum aestuariivivum TaxID=2006131 RepID=UPI003AB16FD1
MMNYKETLFFIGKCLTITHEKDNRLLVEQELKSGTINWDKIVRVTTAHYVFPAVYCNLKRANFLHYLPDDLVDYMEHITNLNRERNKNIIKEAKEINTLLLAHNITPIFLKGTGNLLEGLYEDIAERMVGDIDFIFSKNDYNKAIKILINNNYSKVHKTTYDFPSFKHYPRLQKENKIAAIEIHKELLIEKYSGEFNYNFIKKDTLIFNDIKTINYANQLALSIIATQINDNGQFYNSISLRNSYDVFLLSIKTDSLKAINNFNLLFPPLNNFLACSKKALNSQFIKFEHNKNSIKHLNQFLFSINNIKKSNKIRKRTAKKLYLKSRLNIILKSFFNKDLRIWLFKRLTDISWIKK